MTSICPHRFRTMTLCHGYEEQVFRLRHKNVAGSVSKINMFLFFLRVCSIGADEMTSSEEMTWDGPWLCCHNILRQHTIVITLWWTQFQSDWDLMTSSKARKTQMHNPACSLHSTCPYSLPRVDLIFYVINFPEDHTKIRNAIFFSWVLVIISKRYVDYLRNPSYHR